MTHSPDHAERAREVAHRIVLEFRPGGWPAKEDELASLLLNTFADPADALRGRDRVVEALAPSADTKAEYIGEFAFNIVARDEDGDEVYRNVRVPWDTIKEIMATILARAALHDAKEANP